MRRVMSLTTGGDFVMVIEVPLVGSTNSDTIAARASLVAADRLMRGCLGLIRERAASSDFERRYEAPRGIMMVGVAVNGSDHDIVYSYGWLCEEQDLYIPLVDRGGDTSGIHIFGYIGTF